MLRALWTWRAWIPVAVVLGPLWTTVHEGAHAIGAIAQGGTILEFSVFPSRSPEGNWRFGYMSHALVHGETLVLLAPVIACFLIAFPSALGLRRTPEGRLSRLAFLLGVIFPLGDASLSTAGLAFGRPEADLARVLGGHELVAVPALLLAIAVAGLLARPAFERHFRDTLTMPEYVVLGAAVIGLPWEAGAAMLVVRAMGLLG